MPDTLRDQTRGADTLPHVRGRYPDGPMSEPAPADTSSDTSSDTSADTSLNTADGANLVEVTVPLRTDYIATLRTVAASLGADAGFSIDEIDDLRLAISEIVSSLIDSTTSNDDRIVATFDVSATGVAVVITTRRGELQIELDDLATSILQSVVDEYEVVGPSVNLVKSASEAVGLAGATVERTTPGA